MSTEELADLHAVGRVYSLAGQRQGYPNCPKHFKKLDSRGSCFWPTGRKERQCPGSRQSALSTKRRLLSYVAKKASASGSQGTATSGAALEPRSPARCLPRLRALAEAARPGGRSGKGTPADPAARAAGARPGGRPVVSHPVPRAAGRRRWAPPSLPLRRRRRRLCASRATSSRRPPASAPAQCGALT